MTTRLASKMDIKNRRHERAKEDYTKYLRHVRDVYDFGERGFPPEQNGERLFEWNEYYEWWKEREARIDVLRKRL